MLVAGNGSAVIEVENARRALPRPRVRRFLQAILPRAGCIVLALGVAEAASAIAVHELKVYRGIRYRTIRALLGDEQRKQIQSFIDQSHLWYQKHDPELGWINAPGGSYVGCTQNGQGVRSKHTYSREPPTGSVRIAAFGDSFVHGDEVGDDEVWSSVAESSRPGLEVMNFGVSGYGVDQAYLRYMRDGRSFSPHIVVIGFFPDDLYRDVSVFRPFLAPGTGHQMTKPRFMLRDGQLVLFPNPLPRVEDYRRLLENPEAILLPLRSFDAFFPEGYAAGPFDFLRSVRLLKLAREQALQLRKPRLLNGEGFNPASEAFQTTVAVFDAFHRAVVEDRAKPLIVFFPSEQEVEGYRAGIPPSYEPLKEVFRQRSYDFEDALTPFQATAAHLAPQSLFVKVHYSGLGNAIVARHLLERLANRGWLSMCR